MLGRCLLLIYSVLAAPQRAPSAAIAPEHMGAPPAGTCIASAMCNVPGAHQPDEPSRMWLHFVLDVQIQSEFEGSWLQVALSDGTLDCTFGSDHRSSDGAHEMFFLMLTLGTDAVRRTVDLVPCNSELIDFNVEDLQLRWHSTAPQAAPPTLEEALASASPRAAIVFHMSLIPDIGRDVLHTISAWLRQRNICAAQRALVLHYRAGRLPDGWHEPRKWNATREHLASQRGRDGVPMEAFWNNFWSVLHRVAQADFARELCEARAPTLPYGTVCNASAALQRWCAAPREESPRPLARASIGNSFLLLGGDAHNSRELILQRLHSAGLLDRALWSLSTPAQCSERGRLEQPNDMVPLALTATQRKAWRPFCTEFANGPKRLDLELSGPLEGSNKDRSFPPAALYARTRFSLVFESVVTTDRDYPAFLTEKVLKPLYRGHPFLFMCHVPATWSILHALGFHSFGPTMPEGPFDAFEALGRRCPCCTDGRGAADGLEAYIRALVDDVDRLVDLPDSAWLPALQAAAHNRRHFVCPDGLSRRLRLLSRNVLRFVASVGTSTIDVELQSAVPDQVEEW